jgi:hypothetical protein
MDETPQPEQERLAAEGWFEEPGCSYPPRLPTQGPEPEGEIGPISLNSPPAEGATNGPADAPPLTVAGIRETVGMAPPPQSSIDNHQSSMQPAPPEPPFGFSGELVHEVRRRIGHEGLMLLSLLREVTGSYDGVLPHPPDAGMSDYCSEHRAAAAAQREIELAAAALGLKVELVRAHWQGLLDTCRAVPEGDLLDRGAATRFVLRCLPGQAEPHGETTGVFRQVVLAERLDPGEGAPLDARGREITGLARSTASFASYALAVGKLVLALSLRRRRFTLEVRHCPGSLWEATMRPDPDV